MRHQLVSPPTRLGSLPAVVPSPNFFPQPVELQRPKRQLRLTAQIDLNLTQSAIILECGLDKMTRVWLELFFSIMP